MDHFNVLLTRVLNQRGTRRRTHIEKLETYVSGILNRPDDSPQVRELQKKKEELQRKLAAAQEALGIEKATHAMTTKHVKIITSDLEEATEKIKQAEKRVQEIKKCLTKTMVEFLGVLQS